MMVAISLGVALGIYLILSNIYLIAREAPMAAILAGLVGLASLIRDDLRSE